MTDQLKKRIEMINRGEVPDGYKQTKVGIVPREWEECKFRKKFSRLTRKNKEGNTNVLTISAQYGLISQEDFFNKSIASDDKSNYYLLNKGEFAYNKSYSNGYPFGALKQLTMYDKGIVSPLYICFSATDENKFTDFYSHYFEVGLMNREIQAVAQEGARNHGLLNIAVDDFFNTFLLAPPLPEQEKIAEILTTQDKLIELYQCKIEELKKLKKAYLLKMFSKKGESTPEIRFPGFTDAWEQREFGKVFIEYSEKNHEEVPPLTIIQGQGTLLRSESDRNLQYDKAGLKNYKLVNKDDFILHLRSFEGGLEKANSRGIVSPAYHIFHGEKTDTRFFYAFFRSQYFINVLLKPHVYGIRDGKSIDIDGIKKIKIPFPSLEEQTMIGDYFQTLETLITLHRRKLEEMKRCKKALMQLLLTGKVRVKT